MDYTLAQYIPETFESLAYQHTVEKLVYDLDYPREVCTIMLVVIIFYYFSSVNNDRKKVLYFIFGGLLTFFWFTLYP